MHKALPWKLSIEADKDLEDIIDYTLEKFGEDQALLYASSFDIVFDQLSINPELGRERNEVREGLRSIGQEKHVIFYRIQEDYIRIVRILHGSRDLPKYFTTQ